jgi:acyl transferase domain-containing protein
MNDLYERIARLPRERLVVLVGQVQAQLEETERARAALQGTLEQGRRPEAIAVVGIGCRFPGAPDVDSYWQLLHEGRDAIADIPPGRWDVDALFDADPDAAGKMYVRRGGFIPDIDRFEPQFFGITPREAVSVDPQQRLLLEVSWEALESCGFPPQALIGSPTGVFVGISSSDYASVLTRSVAPLDAYFGTGIAPSVAAGRLAFAFGLQGPTLAVDTACSSSLVAVHLACQSLRNGECSLALAGGVNAILAPETNVFLSRARMLAPDGRCKTFDAAADGYVRSEGCGIVVLKRLSAALAGGDRILAVIRGSAVNQDGRSSGLTAPNGPSQEAVIREAIDRAGVEPRQVQYVEAHGTGTSIGDPIELQALDAALGAGRSRLDRLLVGSVKTNIGHLEAAAGVAGLLKVILALDHEQLPAHLHFGRPNPLVPWSSLAIEVAERPTAWPRGERKRIAGVSSFGFSGTNAHLVVEEPPLTPADEPPQVDRPLHVLTVSARTEAALRANAQRYADRLADPTVSFADFCFTAAAGRSHLEHRLAIVATSSESAREQVAAFAAGSAGPFHRGRAEAAARTDVAFLFTGQGSQYPDMGRALYEQSPVFRAAVDRCATIVDAEWDVPLLEVLYGAATARLSKTEYAQAALFAVEYALTELWRSWGVRPAAVLGHSVGEFVAATVAGVFSLEDGLRLVLTRGRLMQQVGTDGAMVAVSAAEATVQRAVATAGGAIAIAAVNSADQVVVGGSHSDLERLVAALSASSVETTWLSGSQGFHSPWMEPMLDAFEAAAARVGYEAPRIDVISNLTGELSTAGDLTSARYWRRQAREPVRFAAGVAALQRAGYRFVLEIGPTHTLTALARCTASDRCVWVASLTRDGDDWQQILSALSALHVHGVAIDWNGFDHGYGRRKIALPTYAFQRARYWPEVAASVASTPAGQPTPAEPLRDEWIYQVDWIPAPLRAPAATSAASTWVVVTDGSGIGAETARRAAAGGRRVTLVDRDDRQGVLEALQRAEVDTVVYVCCAGLGDTGPAAAAARHSTSVLDLLRAVADDVVGGRPQLWIATRGAQAIEGSTSPVAIHQTALWGLGRTIAAEMPTHWGGLVDLDPDAPDESSASALVDLLEAEPGEDQVAIRNGRQLVARLRRSAVADAPPRRLTWRTDGAYLLTGGFGGIGGELSRWLARSGVRHLILIGRNGVPLRDRWGDAPPDSADAVRIAHVLELESLGASVEVVAVDVADEAAVAGWFERYTRERRPPIRGVFHAAGVTRYLPATSHTDEDFACVWSGKAAGAAVLDRVFDSTPLDLFVMFSSAASVISSPMLAAYAAANAFLDGLASARARRGRPALAVNWGAWGGVGMAAAGEMRQLGGNDWIGVEQGLTTLERLLARLITSAAVLPINWGEWRRLYPTFAAAPLLREVAPESPQSADTGGSERTTLRTAQVASDPDERRRLVTDALTALVARIVRLAETELDPSSPLRNIGLDSLMALELRNRVQTEGGVSIPLVTFVQGPSIAQLARIFCEALDSAPRAVAGPAPAARGSEPNAASLLAGLGEMSDATVDELLRRMLAEKPA